MALYLWFIRTAPDSDPVAPESYEITFDTPSCVGSDKVGALYAELDETTGKPKININIVDNMARALDSRSNYYEVHLADYSWFLRTNKNNDPDLPSSYERAFGTPSCPGTDKICAVYAMINGGGLPILTQSLLHEMKHALDSSSDTAHVLLYDC